MTLFDRAFTRTMDFEGRVTHHDPQDKGGQTHWGISRVNWPNWVGWSLVDEGVTVPEYMVKNFYNSHFWEPANCDQYKNEELSLQVFDWFVNAGSRALKALQALVGEVQDGNIGPKTLEAIHKQEADPLVDAYLARRRAFYHELVDKNPVNGKFINGWLKRCERSVV